MQLITLSNAVSAAKLGQPAFARLEVRLGRQFERPLSNRLLRQMVLDIEVPPYPPIKIFLHLRIASLAACSHLPKNPLSLPALDVFGWDAQPPTDARDGLAAVKQVDCLLLELDLIVVIRPTDIAFIFPFLRDAGFSQRFLVYRLCILLEFGQGNVLLHGILHKDKLLLPISLLLLNILPTVTLTIALSTNYN